METPGGGDQEDPEEAGSLRGRPQQGHQPTFQGDLDPELLQVYKKIRLEECVDSLILRSEYIVPIITFSDVSFSGTSEPAIVYQVYLLSLNQMHLTKVILLLHHNVLLPQWMPNGSLEERLKKETGREPLTWRQR